MKTIVLGVGDTETLGTMFSYRTTLQHQFRNILGNFNYSYIDQKWINFKLYIQQKRHPVINKLYPLSY
jgi:hypothetical protein